MTGESSFIAANICNRRKLWKMIICIAVVLTMSLTNVLHPIAAERNLYIYNDRELSKFVKNMGYQDLWYNDIRISRNSNGTALRFLNEDKRKILVLSCDGSMRVVDNPGYLAWVNDANQVKVWVSWTGNKSVAHYPNGTSEKLPFSPEHGPDPSGKYLIKEGLDSSAVPLNESCYTSIYATERPNIPLAKVDICGVTRVFYKDKKVLLTGSQSLNGTWQGQEIRVFAERANDLEQIDRIIVPSPAIMRFYAVDLNPWDDEMLFIHARDFPARSIWYSFNLKTHRLNKVGKVPLFGGRAFYLQCDIIREVTKAREKKTGH